MVKKDSLAHIAIPLYFQLLFQEYRQHATHQIQSKKENMTSPPTFTGYLNVVHATTNAVGIHGSFKTTKRHEKLSPKISWCILSSCLVIKINISVDFFKHKTGHWVAFTFNVHVPSLMVLHNSFLLRAV